MIGTTIRALGILSFLAVPAIAGEGSETSGFASAAYSYYCADGATIEAAYINMDSGLSLAVLHVDDDMLVMENVVSASGARYATADQDDEDRFVWWTKGDEGFLQRGPDGEETMVHTACTS
jgi:membrane-bound inhibitor of C-type lysozyme